MGRLTIALCVFAVMMSAQEDPLAWFPLQVGNHRVYEHEWKSGDRNRPDVDRWTTEETITGWVTIPEGIVVLREVTPSKGTAHGALIARDSEPYLVRGSCIYATEGGWDVRKRELRPEFRKYLSESAVVPDFCFPLQAGSEWGNNDRPWRVERDSPGLGAIHILSSHFGSGGAEDVWFQKGVGVVGEHYIHNGTYDEYTKKLVSFGP
jgi:hypothetical protein